MKISDNGHCTNCKRNRITFYFRICLFRDNGKFLAPSSNFFFGLFTRPDDVTNAFESSFPTFEKPLFNKFNLSTQYLIHLFRQIFRFIKKKFLPQYCNQVMNTQFVLLLSKSLNIFKTKL
jgi:hypothetical protein